MPMYVYEYVVFDIMVYIQVFYFDGRIWVLWFRYSMIVPNIEEKASI